MARANSSSLDHHLPCNGLLVALTFAATLGMLAISLFWPYLLPFALSIEQVTPSHSSLAFVLLGAGTFLFPLMLLFTAINYTALYGKLRPRAAIIPMRSEDRPTRLKWSQRPAQSRNERNSHACKKRADSVRFGTSREDWRSTLRVKCRSLR